MNSCVTVDGMINDDHVLCVFFFSPSLPRFAFSARIRGQARYHLVLRHFMYLRLQEEKETKKR